jgi:hypothetical protein
MMQQLQAAPLTALGGGTIQNVPVGLARPGLTFDFVRIPIPFPRLIAIPTTPQITIPFAAPQAVAFAPQAAAPVMQQFAPAPVAPVVQQVAAAPVAPFVQQVAAPQAMMPVSGQVTVPVQGQVTVPVNGQVTVPVQGQVPVPAGAVFTQPAPIAAAPQVVTVQAAPAAPIAPTAPAAPQSLNPQDVDAFCRQVDALKAALEAQKAARGCPK